MTRRPRHQGRSRPLAGYIVKRILYMIPTLLAISVVAFTIINLPPGDYVDRLVIEAKNRGETMTPEAIEGLRHLYGLNKPIVDNT